ncbi:MAG: branched-chain amino acid ABC transporter permease [Anaerolineaceae bacterium]|nr:branched-chain amino acid ABC transporter permease [Anaerolineaceae bacterium]
MRLWVFQILNGLTMGSLLFFVAAGLSVVFGLMRILNLSHGAIFLFGGFVGLAVHKATGSFWLAIPAAMLAAGALGFIIQKVFSTTLLGSRFNQVLLTLGLAFIFNNAILAIWGGAPQTIPAPEILATSVKILGVTYPAYRLFLIVLAFVAGTGLWLFWERSRLGAIVRACVDDRDMATAMGIRVEVVFATVFTLGAAIAGMAGVLGGPVLGVSIGLDFDVLLLAVVVMVVGGVGSLSGAFVASLMVGLVDTFGKALFPELSYFTLFSPVIIILIVRPLGLFGRIPPE